MNVHVVHLVATDAFAGVERYITYVAPALAAEGLDLTIVGGDASPMRRAIDGAPVRWHPYEGPRSTVSRLRALQADIIHTHMTAAELVAALGAPRRARIVTTRHFAQPRGSSLPARVVGRLAARRIGRQIAISDFVAAAIESPSVVVRNAVPDRPLGSHDQPVVLVAQRLEQEKDSETAIRAWAESQLSDLGWRLVVAGRGALAQKLQTLISALGVGGSVDVIGFVDDLPERMARASILLAAAPLEPYGLSVVEAMSCGLPVVAARGGAHLETIGAVDERWLFPPGDHRAAANLLRSLAEDPKARTFASGRIQAHQRSELGLATHVKHLIELYEQELGRAAR
jgi:glycosyltransferase involved in cell wall biosynthesis